MIGYILRGYLIFVIEYREIFFVIKIIKNRISNLFVIIIF